MRRKPTLRVYQGSPFLYFLQYGKTGDRRLALCAKVFRRFGGPRVNRGETVTLYGARIVWTRLVRTRKEE